MSVDTQRERVSLTVRVRLLITHPHRMIELIRYGSVGVFINGLYLALYSAIVAEGAPYWAGSLCGYCVVTVTGYWLHEHFSFGGGSPTFRGLGRWLCAQAGTILLNLGLLTLLIHKAHFEEIPAQLVLMPVIPILSYLVGSRWVFTRALAATPDVEQ